MAHMSTSEACPRCDGKKMIGDFRQIPYPEHGKPYFVPTMKCPRCGGSGVIEVEPQKGHFGEQPLQK